MHIREINSQWLAVFEAAADTLEGDSFSSAAHAAQPTWLSAQLLLSDYIVTGIENSRILFGW